MGIKKIIASQHKGQGFYFQRMARRFSKKAIEIERPKNS